MNSHIMRPNSVCDTTPLQRLESQSSCSEPSSPTLNANGQSAMIAVGMCAAAVGVAATKHPSAAPAVAIRSNNMATSTHPNNHHHHHHQAAANSDYVVGVNCLVATGTGGSSGMSTTASTTTTASTASTTALSSLSGSSNSSSTSNSNNSTSNSHLNINNNNNNNINDKSEKSLNIFINTGGNGNGNGVLANGLVGVGGGDNIGGHNKHKMELYGTRKICCRILTDFAILACVGLPILSFSMWGESYKRGFFCNDDSLMHPYHESTVQSWMLYFMCFVIPISMITMVEFFKANSHKLRSFGNLSSSNYYFWHLELPDWLIECYKRIGLLVFGSGVCELTTDIAKYSIGRLRPHFFAVCQPFMPDGSTCENPLNEGRYIEEFSCRALGYSEKILKEAHLSFPSGHASFTSFTMIYTAIYLHKRLTCSRSKMFKHLLQFIFLMFAWYTALTRVSDYKHHWTDVLAGSVIGTVYAIIVTSSMW